MTKPRTVKHPPQPAKRKRGSRLHPDVAAAIKRAWPDGVIEMSFDSEDSWFWDVHPKLVRAFHRLKGARLLNERFPEGLPLLPRTDDDDDDNPPIDYDCEFPRSYHLFFVGSEGEAFTFLTEIETQAGPEYDEDTGELVDGELEMITVHGRVYYGCAVAVSLIAPVAVIALSDYSVYEDGAVAEPAISRYAEDDAGRSIDPESHLREALGQKSFQVLEKLRSRITAILKKQGVLVMPEAEWRKELPWLRGDEEVFVGDGVQQPVRVLDAFVYKTWRG